MRKLLLIAGILALAASAFAVQVPRKAPEFVIEMPDGPQKLLSAYRGKTVVLALMYSTCPHCKKTAQVLSGVQSEYAAKGVQVLGAVFDQGGAFRVQQFSKELGLNFPVGFSNDPTVREFVQLSPTEPYFVPILVFIDKTGTIRSQYIGDEKFLNNQEVNIRKELDKILAARARG